MIRITDAGVACSWVIIRQVGNMVKPQLSSLAELVWLAVWRYAIGLGNLYGISGRQRLSARLNLISGSMVHNRHACDNVLTVSHYAPAHDAYSKVAP